MKDNTLIYQIILGILLSITLVLLGICIFKVLCKMLSFLKNRKYNKLVNKYIKEGYLSKFDDFLKPGGRIKQCFYCHSTDISITNILQIGPFIASCKYNCKQCGKQIGGYSIKGYKYYFPYKRLARGNK